MFQTAIVFDLDDTLYLERDYVRSGFRAVGQWVHERLGYDGFAEKAWLLFEDGVRGDTFNRVFMDWGIAMNADLLTELIRVYREHTPDIVLLPDAMRCLDYLKGKAFLALISDGPLSCQRAKVKQLALDRWLDKIVLTAELGPNCGKPHPLAFQQIEATFGLAKKQCIYVADNPTKDFDAPYALGWKCLRIRRAGGIYSHLDSHTPLDGEMDSLDTLLKTLNI